jgi:hypothetical protein
LGSYSYYVPDTPEQDDYDFVNDPWGINHATFLEHQKQYMKHWEDMLSDRARLYALIMQYLSPESLVEVKRQTDYELMKQNWDVQRLWENIEETHKVFTISHVTAVIKKTAHK